MAISTIVVRGYGSFGGGIAKVPTRGYTAGPAVVIVAAVLPTTPAGRVYNLPAHDRVYEVPEHDRVYEVS